MVKEDLDLGDQELIVLETTINKDMVGVQWETAILSQDKGHIVSIPVNNNFKKYVMINKVINYVECIYI